jgi:hypothetical protein
MMTNEARNADIQIYDAGDVVVQAIPPRQRRGIVRIELSSEPVKIRGEELHEIWWRGKQWAVTAYGVECLDGSYFFEAKRLLENLEYPWPLHMAEKNWVDIDEFATAWMIAILLHGQARKITAKAIRDTISKLPPVGRKY